MPEISIIVPIYKVEKYIHKCIDSILQQTFTDFELILVDDGSPDNCGKICDEYARKDNRIIVIHKQNGGLSDARNAGIEIARGDYIGFVDGDDYIAPNMYKHLYNEIKRSGAELAICSMVYVDEDGHELKEHSKNPVLDEKLTPSEALDKLTEFKGWYYVTAVNRLYNKNLFSKLRFETGRLHEDEFLVHHIFAQCKSIKTIPDKLYYYVQHENSITHSSFSIKKLDAVYAFLDRYYFFKKYFPQKKRSAILMSYSSLLSFFVYDNIKKCKKEFLKLFCIVFKALIKEMDLRTIKLLCVYSINRFSWIKSLKNKIKILVKCIKRVGISLRIAKQIKDKQKKYGKAIIFIATPSHGNLGDQAIVNAQYLFFDELGKKESIVEITRSEYEVTAKLIQKVVKATDIIVIDGGGNIGTLWIDEEYKMRDIIKRFPDNPVFIFPQTAYFSNDDLGEKELALAKKTYESHDKLIVFCRDSVTYNLFQKEFEKVMSFYVPDIVLFTENIQYNNDRQDILFCLRDDKEGTVDNDIINKLRIHFEKLGYCVKDINTVIPDNVNKSSRNYYLNAKWAEFSGAKLIITDRLHGMIFSAISATPCIAFDNISHKVRHGYEWLKEYNYIAFIQDNTNAFEVADSLLNIDNTKYDRSYLDKYFNIMKDEVKKCLQ